MRGQGEWSWVIVPLSFCGTLLSLAAKSHKVPFQDESFPGQDQGKIKGVHHGSTPTTLSRVVLSCNLLVHGCVPTYWMLP